MILDQGSWENCGSELIGERGWKLVRVVRCQTNGEVDRLGMVVEYWLGCRRIEAGLREILETKDGLN